MTVWFLEAIYAIVISRSVFCLDLYRLINAIVSVYECLRLTSYNMLMKLGFKKATESWTYVHCDFGQSTVSSICIAATPIVSALTPPLQPRFKMKLELRVCDFGVLRRNFEEITQKKRNFDNPQLSFFGSEVGLNEVTKTTVMTV